MSGWEIETGKLSQRTTRMDLLAPAFRAAVSAAIAECAAQGLEAIVYETYRSRRLQEEYYRRGRTVIPPPKPVTNAKSNLFSWHGYGLAVDVIHRVKLWGPGDAWFARVAAVFKAHDCKWGGDWKARDLPHFQWGRCKPSPSDTARSLMATRGVVAVWEAVGALGDGGGIVTPAVVAPAFTTPSPSPIAAP